MRVHRRNLQSVASFIGPFLLTLAAVTAGFAQGSYEAQVRGTVTDQRRGDGGEQSSLSPMRHEYLAERA